MPKLLIVLGNFKVPVNPKYVETIDINSLIEQKPLGVNLNEMPDSNYYTTPLPLERHVNTGPVRQVEQPVSTIQQPVSTVQQPVERPVEQPVIAEQPKRKRRTNKKKQENNGPFIVDIPTIPLDDSNVLQYQNNEEKDMPVDEETIPLELRTK